MTINAKLLQPSQFPPSPLSSEDAESLGPYGTSAEFKNSGRPSATYTLTCPAWCLDPLSLNEIISTFSLSSPEAPPRLQGGKNKNPPNDACRLFWKKFQLGKGTFLHTWFSKVIFGKTQSFHRKDFAFKNANISHVKSFQTPPVTYGLMALLKNSWIHFASDIISIHFYGKHFAYEMIS